MATIMSELGDWEKIVEKFELCGGAISDRDKRIVLLKKLPVGTSSALVSSLRKFPDYESMKDELEQEIDFLKDYGTESSIEWHRAA